MPVDLSAVIVKSLGVYALGIAISMLVAVIIKAITVILAWSGDKRAAAAKPAPKPAMAPVTAGVPADHIAAITAAIQAVIGAHRILHIEQQSGAPGLWTLEGRQTHHTSHIDRRPIRH